MMILIIINNLLIIHDFRQIDKNRPGCEANNNKTVVYSIITRFRIITKNRPGYPILGHPR